MIYIINILNNKGTIIILTMLWSFMGLISWNHIDKKYEWLNLSVSLIGFMGWMMAVLTLLYLGRKHIKITLIFFIFFYLIGFIQGPFLEPPVDPFEHLNRTYAYCGISSYSVPEKNKGFWHYTMSGIFLCNINNHPYRIQDPVCLDCLGERLDPEDILTRIDLIHGLYQGMLVTALFLIGINSGLNLRWSIFSALMGFLFFGTNRFSYFSYYTLGASGTSMLIYWLWIGAFFFNRGWNNILPGIYFGLIGYYILWVNHQQESVFLILILSIYIIINIYKQYVIISDKFFDNKFITKMVFFLILFLVFFILPVDESFKQSIQRYFPNNYWMANQNLTVELFSYFTIGDIKGHRFLDSMGLFGFLPVIMTPILCWNKFSNLSLNQRFRSIILGLLPLIVLFTPLLSFIWISNVSWQTYWRITYASLYWVSIAFFMQGSEYYFKKVVNWLNTRIRFSLVKKLSIKLLGVQEINLRNVFIVLSYSWVKSIHRSFYLVSLILLLILSSIRSDPLYGKLDFIRLDSRPWWPEWKTLIELVFEKRKTVYTDPMTVLVLEMVFDIDAVYRVPGGHGGERPLSLEPGTPNLPGWSGSINIEQMIRDNLDNQYHCIINLKGFKKSWVAIETGHWQETLGQTSRHYHYKGKSGDELKKTLSEGNINNCFIFK